MGFGNYDHWKTTPPDERKPDAYCSICRKEMWEGDALYAVDGGICEDCLEDNYKSYV